MRIGIDLGGTKIEALLLDDGGRELWRERIATPRENYPAILEAIAALVDAVEARDGNDGRTSARRTPVGLGIPGTISPATGLVKNANTRSLIGHPLDRDLTQRLQRPVRVANDANCFALSEATDGAGVKPDAPATTGGAGGDALGANRAHVVFGVILGTGTGGGLVVDGRIVEGPDGISGEWGHNPLPWPTDDEWPLPACWCGMRGCMELFLSGPGLAAEHERRTRRSMPAAEIARAADAGDPEAELTMTRYEHRLARGLATIINSINPDVIVVGGGVSNIARLYSNVPRLWREFAFTDVVSTRLVPARHGDSSGVRGAAWLWPV